MRALQYYSDASKEVQSKRMYYLLAQLYQILERVKPYIAETTPALGI